MLENHYAQLPGTKGGGRFAPVYYWVDIFAVTQHFSGDFKDHPDSDFAGVIKSSKAVLFTMHPWRSPIAPTRVWCLFEALTAIQASGVDFEVVVDVKDSKDTRVQTVTVISGSIDVRTAQATVSSDKTYILGCIEQGIGVNAFNNAIRKRLKEALLQAVTPNAVEMGDTAALHELLKIGGCVRPDGIADLASCFRFASEADMLNIMRTIQLRDLRPRGLVLSGKQRTKEVTLSDGGLRGWDGESFSLREYGELDTGRLQWAYLPAGPALCQAVGDLLAMPTHSGAGTTSSNLRGIEELWISLKTPRPDEFAKPNTAGVNGALGSTPNSPKGGPGSGERTGVGSTLLGREASAAGSALPLLRDGIMRSSGSFTSSSPAVTAIRQELSRAGGSSFSGGNSRLDVSRSGGSFPGVPLGGSTLGGGGGGGGSTLGGSGAPLLRRDPSFSSPGNALRPELSRAGGASFSSSGALGPERSSGLVGERSGLMAERSSGSFSSATAARAAQRAAASPVKRRPTFGSITGSATFAAGRPSSAMHSCLDSPSAQRAAATAAAMAVAGRGAPGSPLMPAPPSGPAPPPGSRPSSARPVSGRPGSMSGAPSSPSGAGAAQQRHMSPARLGLLGPEGSSASLAMAPASPTIQQQPQKLEPLPPGRPALWAAVAIGRTLRHLCVHQSVLAPPDVALLANALQNNKILEILQFVKCSAPGAESSGAHSTARLTGELLALGLSAGNLRQLHVRPADPLFIENLPPISTPSNSNMRRISLTPVLLAPAAIRQLGRALAQPSQLHSITVGLDPAPFTTFMPRELCDREHWLVHEDKNEPDMALKRRRIMGLDDDGQAAYVAHAWDLKEELTSLPDSERGVAAAAQRAAGITFCLCVAAGWADVPAYNRRYARWSWQRRMPTEESLADMKKYLGPLKELAAEALKAAPDTFTNKFDPSKKDQRAAKSRLQAAYFETFA
ncbi:hypothetical protein HXX76_010334 [Chlamydomonas incerta]|uniref:Uncharacterized protein n=1 Tax=Chlamydomonas incerta TaxID=51695 RepID=A0A835T290_CHLIN|nr:hypothetical protein HXX76_010334 [Chlamydomonas incerta]|eukprot:KAG2430236.1 hypothetical protein HXX76_010334 [Chlamydomonas incerta]